MLVWLSIDAKTKYPLLWDRGINIVEQIGEEPLVTWSEIYACMSHKDWALIVTFIDNDCDSIHPQDVEDFLASLPISADWTQPVCAAEDGL